MIPNFAAIKIMYGRKRWAELVLIYTQKGWKATAFYNDSTTVYKVGSGEEVLDQEEAEQKVKELADAWRKTQKA
jgi:hypothetical protein